MIRLIRDFRLVPVVLMATIALFALKALGLVFDGGYTLSNFTLRIGDEDDVTGTISPRQGQEMPADEPRPAAPPPRRKSWMQQVFNFPDVTGAVPENQPPPASPPRGDRTPTPPAEPPPKPVGTSSAPGERTPSSAERAILERLAERRAELDARARELDMRESLLQAAEKRLEARIAELKGIESRISTAAQQKDESEVQRLKNVVTMYENMKAKDAAKIFDRLDMRVLIEVATQINPRRMSDILAQMTPDAAERLTVELAARAKDKPGELPKIEGRPPTN
jgi:flagellar motility protein MotE (MotC chaperone)